MFYLILFVCIAQVTKVTCDISSHPVTDSTSPHQDFIKIEQGLSGLASGVTSNEILFFDNGTIKIHGFHFDGTAPKTKFLVGDGGRISENGTYLNTSQEFLQVYSGEDIELVLPDNLTMSNVKWLAVWSVEKNENLGYVFFRKRVPPQTFNFSSDEVQSNPVVLIDKKNIFVPNFRYKGGHKNVKFWVGNGTGPNPEGVAISDSLGINRGTNINLQLPEGLTTDNIDYLGVWSIDEEQSLGVVQIRGIKGVLEFDSTSQLTKLVLPKCCPIDSVRTAKGCEVEYVPFEPNFPIYDQNETHFSNESMDVASFNFVMYSGAPKCKSGVMYPLEVENEEFGILKNTSLLLKGSNIMGVFPTDEYCIDNLQDGNDFNVKILFCFPEQPTYRAMIVTYIVFTIVSTFLLAATFCIYVFLLKVGDIHRRYFSIYCFTMTITFLCLTIIQLANVEESGCKAIAFFFQIFMIASFTLLAILCIDVYIINKYIDDKIFEKKRNLYYISAAAGIPFLSLIISLCRNLTPDVPNAFFKSEYMKNACHFEAQEQRTVFFYVPIGVCIVVSIVSLVLTKLAITKNDKDEKVNYFWIENGRTYKFMLRKHLIILLMSGLWFVEAIINDRFATLGMQMAIDLIEACQGLLIFVLFVLNKETITKIVKLFKRKPKKNTNNGIELETLNRSN